MVCSCGRELSSRDRSCPGCGAPPAAEDRAAPRGGGSGEDGEAPARANRVLARWSNKLWYPGTVDDEREGARHVVFDDGDRGWVTPPDLTVEQDPTDDRGGRLAVGAKVMGRWVDRKWYPGTVVERFGRVWRVAFDDGDRAWLGTDRIRVGQRPRWMSYGGTVLVLLLAAGGLVWATLDDRAPSPSALRLRPVEPLSGPPAEGMRVLAPFGARGAYFVGAVREVRPDGQVEVLFLDGDHGVVEAGALRRESLGPGSLVEARAGTGQGWYEGQVREREGDRVQVRFGDGEVAWVPLAQIRLAPPPAGE